MALNDWTPTMTQDRIGNLLLQVGEFFGVSRAEVERRILAGTGRAEIWNWLGWAICEWQYGWPPDIAKKARALGARSALDFGAGCGEAGLHLWAWLDIPVTFCDLPGETREFLAWRIGRVQAINVGKPLSPREVLRSDRHWDAVLLLEVLEHIKDASALLRRLLERADIAVCISGVNGRPETDCDPLHIYRESLLPVLAEEGWELHSGGGMPWWFVRREWAKAQGIAVIGADGTTA